MPFWSETYIKQSVIGKNTSVMQNGHNYDVAVWADKVVAGGIAAVAQRLQPPKIVHYITDHQNRIMFLGSDGKQLWDTCGNSEPAQDMDGFFKNFYDTAKIRSIPLRKKSKGGKKDAAGSK